MRIHEKKYPNLFNGKCKNKTREIKYVLKTAQRLSLAYNFVFVEILVCYVHDTHDENKFG